MKVEYVAGQRSNDYQALRPSPVATPANLKGPKRRLRANEENNKQRDNCKKGFYKAGQRKIDKGEFGAKEKWKICNRHWLITFFLRDEYEEIAQP